MKKSLLYTRTGDAGMTSLVGGARVAKNCARVCAYGSVDELNSLIGLLRAHIVRDFSGAAAGYPCDPCGQAELLGRVSNLLFNIGACLADPSADAPEAVAPDDLSALETAIDTLDSLLPEQRTFILPGGCVAAAHAHVARSVCRRAERDILTLADTGAAVQETVLRYINRLSDYLFILARHLNHLASLPDIPWQK